MFYPQGLHYITAVMPGNNFSIDTLYVPYVSKNDGFPGVTSEKSRVSPHSQSGLETVMSKAKTVMLR